MAKKKVAANKPTEIERAAVIFGMQMQHVLQRICDVEASCFVYPTDGSERIDLVAALRKELADFRMDVDRTFMFVKRDVEELKSNPQQKLWARLRKWFWWGA